jgi:hypothetical protein
MMSGLKELITSDDDSELGFALGKALQKAAETGKKIRIYSRMGYLWMTDYPMDCTTLVAVCWPGGRCELKRLPEGHEK